MAESNVPQPSPSGRLVRRSVGMLRPVRGLIVVSAVVGVIAAALPYVTAAAFGPMMQVVADAGASGNLSGVWGSANRLDAARKTQRTEIAK